MVIKDYSTVQLQALDLWQRSGHFNSNGQVHEWRMILATQIVDKVQDFTLLVIIMNLDTD